MCMQVQQQMQVEQLYETVAIGPKLGKLRICETAKGQAVNKEDKLG